MRVLGLDLGEKRIGLAISDEEAAIAFPAGWIERAGLRRDLAALRALVRERGVERAVVGLPVHMNGRSGVEAQAAERFAAALAEAAAIPVDTLDERWTTVAAERSLREAGSTRRGRARGTVDAVAAALLLSTYLERRRSAARGGT
jgi:putative Holliday junction resolvase